MTSAPGIGRHAAALVFVAQGRGLTRDGLDQGEFAGPLHRAVFLRQVFPSIGMAPKIRSWMEESI